MSYKQLLYGKKEKKKIIITLRQYGTSIYLWCMVCVCVCGDDISHHHNSHNGWLFHFFFCCRLIEQLCKWMNECIKWLYGLIHTNQFSNNECFNLSWRAIETILLKDDKCTIVKNFFNNNNNVWLLLLLLFYHICIITKRIGMRNKKFSSLIV